MYKILKAEKLSENIFLMDVHAPRVASHCEPGQFVIVKMDEKGERIPLTICDYDREAGTITIVVQEVGASTVKMSELKAGDSFRDFVGPLGCASEFVEEDIEELKKQKILFVAGGLGTAPVYPQVKWLHEHGVDADVIIGAKTKDLVIMEKEMEAVAGNLYVTTDDGSYGRSGMVTQVIKDLVEKEGETLSYDNIENQEIFAVELRKFLDEFQQIPCENGPDAGKHNFYRGGNLKVYNHETVEALNTLSNNINNAKLLDLWHLALASNEQIKNMWVHGDVAPGNLLIKNGHLCAVIDFGILGVGDPACDYAMAWTFFNSQGREVFLKGLSQAMRNRAMGWALWKALITYESDEEERRVQARYTIAQIEKDYD